MGSQLSETGQIYERLWNEAIPAFERNDLELDRHLPDKINDLRRGLTLALRPSRAVQASINEFLDKLREVAPGQYFYRPEEFHVTVLAIIPGTESWQERIQHLPEYQAGIDAVLKRQRKFAIKFQGVTVSPGAVMIQGFPTDDTLAQIRQDLREELSRRELAGQLDARYKISSAHITVMRFCTATASWKDMLALLKENRTVSFGETIVTGFELILGDWYASAETSRTLHKYSL